MRRLLGRRGGEDGFSVFEVVVAAAILFFAITAILGLVATTTDMGINARRRNLVTNAIASRMERYRSLPFDRVALYPAGDILPNETITMARYTVSLSTQVRDLPDGTKEIRLTATVTTADRPPVTTVASTYVRDRDIDFTALSYSSGRPLVRFGASTPARNTVVFNDQVEGGLPGSLRFHAISESPNPADAIQEMRLDCGGLLRDSPFGTANSALWNDYTGGDSTQEEYFTWHTRSTIPTISDGWRRVTLTATNERGTGSTYRDFYVDNYPPYTPTTLTTAAPTSDVLNRLTWNLCKDNRPGDPNDSNDYAAWYDLEVWELTTDSGALPTTSTVYQQITGINKDVPTLGFSRYHAAVESFSTRGLHNEVVRELSPRPFVSRPLASGENTYTSSTSGANRTDRTTTRLRVATPRFPVLGKVVYRLYRRKDPAAAGAETLIPAATRELTPTVPYEYRDAVTYTGGKQTAYLPYHYLLSVEFKAVGYGSTGASETVWSNRLGPTSTNATWTALGVEGW